MKISANHLKRYQEIGLLLWKYGRSDLVQQMGIDEAVDPQEVTWFPNHSLPQNPCGRAAPERMPL